MNKTHWRKNKDPKFLNGEDLKYNLAEGIKDGIIVEIFAVNETESFDPNTQQKTQVSQLLFKDLNGKQIKKGVIPGKWTYDFMKYNGNKSPFLDDWIGMKVILYAQADKRFGHVIRFKKYTPAFDYSPFENKMRLCKNIEELATYFKGLEKSIRESAIMVKCKDEMKKSYESN